MVPALQSGTVRRLTVGSLKVSTSACRCFTLQLPSSRSDIQLCEVHITPSTSSASAEGQVDTASLSACAMLLLLLPPPLQAYCMVIAEAPKHVAGLPAVHAKAAVAS